MKIKTCAMLRLISVLVLSLAACTAIPPPPPTISSTSYRLSQGNSVPVGQLEAVGTVPGCTATLIADNLVLTAAHCVCPSETDAKNCATRRTFTLHDVFPVDDPATPLDESKTRLDVSISGNVRVHPEYTQRDGFARIMPSFSSTNPLPPSPKSLPSLYKAQTTSPLSAIISPLSVTG